MSKQKTLAEQLSDMQIEINQLKELKKLFDKAVKLEFKNYIKQLHKLMDYWNRICQYFGLKSNNDVAKFIALICTNQNLNYFNIHNNKKNVENCTERVAYITEHSDGI